MRAAKCIDCPLTPKYSASGFSSRGRSIISKHLWNTLRCKFLNDSVVLIPEFCTFGKNPRRTLASGKFRNQFRRFPSVKNTGYSDVFPSPSKVVASEYKIMDNRWFKDGRVFSVSSHQFPSYTSPNILIPLAASFFRIPL